MAALAYLDSQAADDTADGLGWATPKLTIGAANAVAGDGGSVFAQDSVSGGFIETQASSKVYSFSGALDNPIKFYACKSGTTNEPPVAADLVSGHADSDAAILQVTGGGNDLTLNGKFYMWGFIFDSADQLFVAFAFDNAITLEQCKFIHPERMRIGAAGVRLRLVDCDYLWTGSGNNFYQFNGGFLEIIGGTITDDGVGGQFRLIDGQGGGRVLISGVDLSSLQASAGVKNIGGTAVNIQNCKIPESYVLSESGEPSDLGGYTKMVGCDNSADHTNTIRQYRYDHYLGYIVDDTPFISGGAQDRSSGDGYCFSMNVNDNKPTERFNPLYTEWFEVPLDGTETSLIIEFMRKDTGAPADVDNEMVWVEYQGPNEGVGSATSQYARQSSAPADALAAAAALTSSSVTWSNLAGDVAKKQKIVFTISPEYAGVARYRVAYAERGTSILPLYFDPLPTLA